MPPKKIPLREIERSIAINSAIDYKAKKTLQFVHWQSQGGNHFTLGRMIFVYLALKYEYTQEEICDYLSMSDSEFTHNANCLDEHYTNGRQLFENVGMKAGYQETRAVSLTFYRKLVLAQNYLRYRFGD